MPSALRKSLSEKHSPFEGKKIGILENVASVKEISACEMFNPILTLDVTKDLFLSSFKTCNFKHPRLCVGYNFFDVDNTSPLWEIVT